MAKLQQLVINFANPDVEGSVDSVQVLIAVGEGDNQKRFNHVLTNSEEHIQDLSIFIDAVATDAQAQIVNNFMGHINDLAPEEVGEDESKDDTDEVSPILATVSAVDGV